MHLRYYIPAIYMHYFLFHQHLSLQTIDSYHQIHQNLTDSCHQSWLPFYINESGTSRYELTEFLAAGMSYAQHIIAARICLLEVSFVDMSIPSYNSIN